MVCNGSEWSPRPGCWLPAPAPLGTICVASSSCLTSEPRLSMGMMMVSSYRLIVESQCQRNRADIFLKANGSSDITAVRRPGPSELGQEAE